MPARRGIDVGVGQGDTRRLTTEDATKAAEAARYRLQVRLGWIAEKAGQDGADALKAEARALRTRVDAIVVADDEPTTGAAAAAVAALEPEVARLQAAAGVESYGLPLFPKWVKFGLWTSPVLVGLGVLGFVFERRRRKRELTAETIAALDESAQR